MKHSRQHRAVPVLFGASAIVDFVIAVIFLLPRDVAIVLLQLGPEMREGPGLAFLRLSGVMLLGYAFAFLQAARDPVANRPFVVLGLLAKPAAVGVMIWQWYEGAISLRLLMIVSIELLLATLFVLNDVIDAPDERKTYG